MKMNFKNRICANKIEFTRKWDFFKDKIPTTHVGSTPVHSKRAMPDLLFKTITCILYPTVK